MGAIEIIPVTYMANYYRVYIHGIPMNHDLFDFAMMLRTKNNFTHEYVMDVSSAKYDAFIAYLNKNNFIFEMLN